MKKKILAALATILIFVTVATAQTNLFNAGICHTSAAPAFNPGAKGCRVVLDTTTQTFYVWKIGTTWVALGDNVQMILGCSAPLYTPNKWQSEIVINRCSPNPVMYVHVGAGVWEVVGGVSVTYTAGTGIAISGSNVISNTGDLSATNELNTAALVTGGNLRITDAGGNLDVAVSSIAPVQAVSAGTGISISGTTTRTVSSTITQADGSETIVNAGTGISVSGAGTSGSPYVVTNTGDLSTTNELQNLSLSGQSISISGGTGVTLPIVGATASDFDLASGVLSLDYTNAQKATSSVPGFLTAADWTTFNSKDPSSTNEIQVANNGLSDNEASGILRLGNRYMNGSDGLFTMDRKVNLSGFVGYFGDNTDSSLLILDGVNDRIGVGVAPSGKIHVKGAGTSTGIGLEVDNSDATITTKLLDNGQFQMIKSANNIFKITPGSSGLDGTVAIGRISSATQAGSIALGTYCEASGTYSSSLGAEASAQGLESTAIGRYSIASGSQSFSFGHFLSNTLANAFLIGSGFDANSSSLVNSLYTRSFGVGIYSRVPQFVVRGMTKSSASWTASGTTVTFSGHGLSAGEPIILHGPGTAKSYHTILSVPDANTFVVSGTPGASGTDWRTYLTANIVEFTNGTNGTILAALDKYGKFGIGTSSPDRLLHSESSDAVTNSVTYPQRLTHITSGTATTGFGAGQEIELENASGTNRVAQTEETTWSDAVNATEDATWKLRLIKDGTLTDAVTVTSTGDVTAAASITGTNMISTATVRLKGYTVATLPAGVVGDMAYVTDALAPAYGVAVVGGGAVVTPVFYNGTAWTTR